MLGAVLDFIEDSDPIFLALIGFSIVFFSVVITKSVKEVNKAVKKEKAIRKLEGRYDSLCQHRSNLIVSRGDCVVVDSDSTIIIGPRRMGRRSL